MTGFTRLRRQSAAAVHSAGRTRAVIVELNPQIPTVIGFRLLRTRKTYYLDVAACYRDAVRNELARQRAERKAARKKGG